MKSFSQFNIKPSEKAFAGEKIEVEKLLNRQITVLAFKIVPSKFKDKGDCLYLSIKLDENMRLLFTSSQYLIDLIKQVPEEDFPFTTVIQKENKRLLFT